MTDFVRSPRTLVLGEGKSALLQPAKSFAAMIRHSARSNAIVINGSFGKTLALALCFALFPLLRRPLVLVDVVLRPPRTRGQRLFLTVKRRVFRRVDHFIHYFRDLSGYETIFGISSAKSSYVPFKVNIWGAAAPSSEGGHYILTLGRSQRDYDTFIRAMSGCPYPAVMTAFSYENVEDRSRALTVSRSDFPSNVEVVADSGTREELVATLHGARVVVIPTLKGSICASGISIYLDAMYLKKCVVLSQGPGASDVLTDEAVLVEPGNVGALQNAIKQAWEDDSFRSGFQERGHAYALGVGGEEELLQRVTTEVVRWLDATSASARRD